MKGSSKAKRHKKKARDTHFEAIDKLVGEEREVAIAALAPKMRLLFAKWRENG